MTTLIERRPSIDELRAAIEESYYTCDCTPADRPGGLASFRWESVLAGPLPLAIWYGSDLSVRRRWTHIRHRSSKRYVLWFPLEGALSITQDRTNEQIADSNNFVLTCGDRPFYMRAVGNSREHGSHLMHMVIPAHIIRALVPNVDQVCGQPFSSTSGAAFIGRGILKHLISEARNTSPDAAAKLAMSALEAIADTVKRSSAAYQSTPLDSKQLHAERVFRYIQQNMSTQGLTADHVAKACKMSRRYFHYVMKATNTTFGKYLWEVRLTQAHRLLKDSNLRHFNIVDIAYMCGFRSSSHFTNLFKSRFGFKPRDIRSCEQQVAA